MWLSLFDVPAGPSPGDPVFLVLLTLIVVVLLLVAGVFAAVLFFLIRRSRRAPAPGVVASTAQFEPSRETQTGS